jgi:hypothetical protein
MNRCWRCWDQCTRNSTNPSEETAEYGLEKLLEVVRELRELASLDVAVLKHVPLFGASNVGHKLIKECLDDSFINDRPDLWDQVHQVTRSKGSAGFDEHHTAKFLFEAVILDSFARH